MLKNDLQDEIIIKTKGGDFKLFKNEKLEELPSDELIIPKDDLMVSKIRESRPPLARPMASKPTASFYFDVDDEHEIRKFRNSQDDDKNKAIRDFIQETVKDIISQAGLGEVASQDLQLKNIIISRLKDVRTLAETREALLRQSFRGQVLGREQLGNLLNLVERKRSQVEEVIRTGRLPSGRGIKRPLIQPSEEILEAVKSKYQKSEPVLREVKQEPGQVDLGGVKYERKPEVVRGDELTRHIITGPIEEIKNLTLKDFRRLGENPEEAAQRVLQKIDLLGDESLVKRAEGIKAWHDSEVYRIYLEIGAKSMAEKKPVEKVILEYRQANKSYLSPDEFNEVADLNRKLSY
jgi:hypothetical protein